MFDETSTDPKLLQRVRDWRDDEGWLEFYRRYGPVIKAHARRSGLSADEAEDVVQNTMLKVATYLPNFEYDRTVCRFRTWLNQVVNQRILAIWSARRQDHLPEAVREQLDEIIADEANPGVEPVGQTQFEERLLQVCLARARMSVRHRTWQIFEANVFHAMDAQTVARRYRTTVANVWLVRYRLLGKLRTEWRALLNEPFTD
jgi:RNA polymerase sigma factor (sigma-70 family)